jgi:hypothetical protein
MAFEFLFRPNQPDAILVFGRHINFSPKTFFILNMNIFE